MGTMYIKRSLNYSFCVFFPINTIFVVSEIMLHSEVSLRNVTPHISGWARFLVRTSQEILGGVWRIRRNIFYMLSLPCFYKSQLKLHTSRY